MNIDKNNVQCISFFRKAHPVHEAWMKSVSSRKILSFIPDKLLFGGVGIKKIPILTQLISIIYGIFTPSAKIYLVEAPATISCVLFKRGKVICINSDPFFYNLKHSSIFIRAYAKILLKRVDGFISTSEVMKRLATKKSEVVYPFMENNELFKIHPNFNNENIGNVSGIRYTKGTDILIDVFKEYRKKHPDAQLYAPGWGGGDSKTDWIKKIKEVGGIAPGFVPSPPYYKKCSIYINPARHEPFGVNILEAMAAGIPPLVSEYCGASEIVKKVDKRLIISLNPSEIVKKIEWLKENKKRYYELSRKCRMEAKKYTKENSIKDFKFKLIKLMDEIR